MGKDMKMNIYIYIYIYVYVCIYIYICMYIWGFSGGSVCKESACNAGDPSSIPGSGSSPGGEIGYPLLYSWASLVAQTVKNPPAMREISV